MVGINILTRVFVKSLHTKDFKYKKNNHTNGCLYELFWKLSLSYLSLLVKRIEEEI